MSNKYEWINKLQETVKADPTAPLIGATARRINELAKLADGNAEMLTVVNDLAREELLFVWRITAGPDAAA